MGGRGVTRAQPLATLLQPGGRGLKLLCACACVGAAACGGERNDGRVAATLAVGELLGGADTLHARAVEPRVFTFPADHGPHPEFRTEWWYFTGNVTATDGRELGYQLTFFRSALTDSASFVSTATDASAWRSRHAYMAHFAVSDITDTRFHAAQRFARAALGLAGAEVEPFRVGLDGWHASSAGDDMFPVRLVAADGDVAIDLLLEAGKQPVLQGERGLSRKGPEPGNASYYYSHTRMPTTGTIRVGAQTFTVAGASWLDREWSTSALSPDLEGWDWMALQLDDETDLMLYRLRRPDGTAGPFSAGRFVARDGSSSALSATDFTMTPLQWWRSPLDGASYPTSWRVDIPRLGALLDVSAAFPAQELNLAVRYWEGSVVVSGTRAGRAVQGRGYLEMTGY
jgi:predicted secreted hydrolase